MAPYLLLGFVVAGMLSVCVPAEWVERHLGGGWGGVWKASVLGVPLPLCSCGVIPVAASIRRHGASRGATASFLLSTPQTGVDSIAVTYALLGPLFAIFRPLAALITGLFGGMIVHFLGAEEYKAGNPTKAGTAPCADDCCTPGQGGRLARGLRYGLVTLPRDIGAPLVLGILIASAIAVLVPTDSLSAYIGGGAVSMILMIAIGIPIYVCATASVPIALGFIHMGASPGAALAFLIAGPATNAATFTTLWKILGKRTAIVYLGVVAFGAVSLGLLLDWLFPTIGSSLPEFGEHAHAEVGGWFSQATAIVLVAVLVVSWQSHRIAFASRLKEERNAMESNADDERLEFRIGGMTCSHCAQAVGRALGECAGVDAAKVDLERGAAIVRGHDMDADSLRNTVESLGYTIDDQTDNPAT